MILERQVHSKSLEAPLLSHEEWYNIFVMQIYVQSKK